MSATNLTVTTAAVVRRLVSVPQVKVELGILDDSKDDKLNRLVDAVSLFLSGAIGLDRPAWRQTYTELLPGRGGHYLHVSRWPIESITQILINGVVVDNTTYSISGSKESVYRSDGWVTTPTKEGLLYSGGGDEKLVYQVDYVAGWYMPEEDPSAFPNGEVLPEEIRDAAMMVVCDRYRLSLLNAFIKSEELEDHRIDYWGQTDSHLVSKAAIQVMRNYR